MNKGEKMNDTGHTVSILKPGRALRKKSTRLARMSVHLLSLLLLWPLALVVINDPAVWDVMKSLCEEIGYCGVHVA